MTPTPKSDTRSEDLKRVSTETEALVINGLILAAALAAAYVCVTNTSRNLITHGVW